MATAFAGVPVRLSWDLLLILALPVVGAMTKGRPYGVEGSAAAVWAVVAGAIGLAFIGSVAAHEFAHALVARRVGLPVRWVKLSLLGGAAEISAERSTPADEVAVAIAGPGVSFALGVVTGLLALVSHERNGPLFALFIALAIMNGLLVVSESLPGLPARWRPDRARLCLVYRGRPDAGDARRRRIRAGRSRGRSSRLARW